MDKLGTDIEVILKHSNFVLYFIDVFVNFNNFMLRNNAIQNERISF